MQGYWAQICPPPLPPKKKKQKTNFTFKSHSNIYIGHIYQFNQLIINANNVLQ